MPVNLVNSNKVQQQQQPYWLAIYLTEHYYECATCCSSVNTPTVSTSNTATYITITSTAVQNVQYCIILTPILIAAQPWANGTDVTICRPGPPITVTSLEEATQYQIVTYLVGPQLQRSGQTSPVIVTTNHAGWCTMCMYCYSLVIVIRRNLRELSFCNLQLLLPGILYFCFQLLMYINHLQVCT